jgi:hypothetical protein
MCAAASRHDVKGEIVGDDERTGTTAQAAITVGDCQGEEGEPGVTGGDERCLTRWRAQPDDRGWEQEARAQRAAFTWN